MALPPRGAGLHPRAVPGDRAARRAAGARHRRPRQPGRPGGLRRPPGHVRSRPGQGQANALMTGASRSTSSGPARSGSDTKTVLTPRSASCGNGRCVGGRTGMVSAGEDSGTRPAAQPLDKVRHMLAIPAEHRDVEHGDQHLSRIPSGLIAMRAQDGQLAVEGGKISGQIAAVPEPGGDLQGSLLACAPHDDRYRHRRARVAGGFRQRYPLAVMLPGARLPQGPQRLDGHLQHVEPSASGREGQPEAFVLAGPPAGADAAERPSARERVEGGRGLGQHPGARRVTGVTRVPSRSRVSRPPSMPSVTHGSGMGSHARPTWGIWIRWSISAIPANPASAAVSATAFSQPAGSSPHGNLEICSTKAIAAGRWRWSVRARPVPGVCAGSMRAAAGAAMTSQPSWRSEWRRLTSGAAGHRGQPRGLACRGPGCAACRPQDRCRTVPRRPGAAWRASAR